MIKFPNWEPPAEARDFGEFAAKMLIPDGPYRGMRYNPTSEAPQQIICDVMSGKIKGPDGNRYRTIVFCSATQTGKSLISVLIPTLHTVIEKRESCVYCLPTLDLLGKVWADKLKPAIEGSGFEKWIPEKGPGSRGGRPSSLPLVNPKTGDKAGSIIFIAGGSGKRKEVGQAGVTVSTVVIDEADEYEDMHRVALVGQRAASFGRDSTTVITSTVKKDEDSVILGILRDSCNARVHYQCPLCGKFQAMEWEQVSYCPDNDVEASKTARYECLHCKEKLTEHDRLIMISEYRCVMEGQTVDDAGKVIGDIPQSLSFGILSGKLDYSIGYGLEDLAVEHRKAQRAIDQVKDHGLMRSFYRDRLSRQYTQDRAEIPEIITNKFLAAKSKASNWHKKTVPSWAKRLYIGIDVQHDRLYWSVIAVSESMQWGIVDWGYEYGECPQKQKATEAQRFEQLNLVRDMSDAGWTIAGSEESMIPSYGCVDVGYMTDEVTHWINLQPKSQIKGWIAVRGYGEGEDERGTKAGKKKSDLAGWGEMRHLEERREYWLFCHSQNVIRWMHDSLMRPAGAASSGEIPKDTNGQGMRQNNSLLLHLTQTVWDFDLDKGKWYWRKMHAGRRDLRDCVKYALTLARFHQMDLAKTQGKKKEK